MTRYKVYDIITSERRHQAGAARGTSGGDAQQRTMHDFHLRRSRATPPRRERAAAKRGALCHGVPVRPRPDGADQPMTLLQNKNEVLPLDKKVKKIAFIGPVCVRSRFQSTRITALSRAI